MLICKHCESKHWIDHKLVTPINSERSVQCKTSSVEASRRASPPGLRVIKTNRRPGIRVDRVQGSRETMSIANNIDYGGAFSTIPCAAGAAPSELEVMRMSTVSAVPQCDESFEQGGQRGVKKHASSHDYFKPHRLKEEEKSPFPNCPREPSLLESNLQYSDLENQGDRSSFDSSRVLG